MSSFSKGDEEPSAAEWAVMALSVAVTVLLFGYIAWHATTLDPGATPEATVTGAQTTDDGQVIVTIEVSNPGRRGLESVAVSADCTNESITFTHVPSGDRRTGSLVCPGPADDPSASIRSWTKM